MTEPSSPRHQTHKPPRRQWQQAFRRWPARRWLYFAWVISLTASLGSLFFSVGLGWIPCDLCWYQRICMYPLAVILGIAVYHGDTGVVRYAQPLAVCGGAIALYHVLDQTIPRLHQIVPCSVQVPCSVDHLHLFGFVSLPMLSLSAFVLIGACLQLARIHGGTRDRGKR